MSQLLFSVVLCGLFLGWKGAGRVRWLTVAAELPQGCSVRALLGSHPDGWSMLGGL